MQVTQIMANWVFKLKVEIIRHKLAKYMHEN